MGHASIAYFAGALEAADELREEHKEGRCASACRLCPPGSRAAEPAPPMRAEIAASPLCAVCRIPTVLHLMTCAPFALARVGSIR